MTRHMEVDYSAPFHPSRPSSLKARVTHNEGRKHWTEASIVNEEGTALATGKGLFIEVRPRQQSNT